MKKLSIIFPLALLFLWGCQDVIDLQLPDGETQLVVDGWLTNLEGEKTVKLSLSANYFSNEPNPGVSGAQVILYNEEGPVDTLRESPEKAGTYLTDFTGVIGQTYHLLIRTPDKKEYASQPQELREVAPITDISYEYVDDNPFLDPGYYIRISSYEPAGLGDYYRWRQLINGVYQNTPFDIVIASDEFVDGNDIINFEVGTQPLEVGDTCRIEQHIISKEAFDFLFLVRDQTAFVGSIFDSPPAPIRGNIYNIKDPEDRPLGFFGVSGVSTAEIVVEE